MPFYEYQCKNCGHELEAMQKISEAPLKKCPECGKSQLQRLISAPVFRLKGGGWYETDFKGDKDKQRNLADKSDSDAGKDTTAKTESDAGSTGATAEKPVTKDGDAPKKSPETTEKTAEKPAKKAAAKSARKPSKKVSRSRKR